MTIALAEPEARSLEAFCRRQLRWDAQLPARLVSSDNALGMFTAPPLGVLVFVAVPTVTAVTEPFDVVVRLADLAAALRTGVLAGGTAELDPTSLPPAMVPVTRDVSVRDAPPAEGWQIPLFAVSGDLVPMVTQATAEFDARTKGLPPRSQEDVATEIWSRPAWGGLPMRVLHAARQLGMLTDDGTRVAASTCGSWKRLSTSRGQVFVPVTGPAALLTLRVDR